jgi:glycosyltransferase involved in cell wall biosynthesis
MRWGKASRLLHPAIPLDRYNPDQSFEERETDLIYIGRVDPLKLGSPTIFKRMPELRTLIVGAENKGMFPDYEPDITWVKNATFTELSEHLGNSKVYVHWKGLLNRRDPEHLGIVVCEAMASGIPTIVPKAGGPWTDVSDFGKYAIGVNSVEEAIQTVHKLLEDKNYWLKWHNKSIEGVKKFGYSTALEKIEGWLGEIQ